MTYARGKGDAVRTLLRRFVVWSQGARVAYAAGRSVGSTAGVGSSNTVASAKFSAAPAEEFGECRVESMRFFPRNIEWWLG